MSKSSRIKEKVLWSINMKHEEFDEECKNPLCTIVQRGSYFSVLYHGCCEINTAQTLEDAKQYFKNYISRRSF